MSISKQDVSGHLLLRWPQIFFIHMVKMTNHMACFLLIWFQSPAFSKALNCKSFQNLKLRKMSNWIVFQQIIKYIRSHGLLDSWFNTYTVMAQIFKSFILLSLVSWHLNVQLHLRYLSWFLNKHCQGKNWWERG